jgi:hypothetical protein
MKGCFKGKRCFKTTAGMGMNPKTLQQKRGIPVLPLEYGNLGKGRETFFNTLRTMGAVLGKEQRPDPAYRTLTAVKKGLVYGVLPYNWYATNYGSVLANAYFIGNILYPERFTDIDPVAKTNDIYSFLVGKPVFAKMNDLFQGLVFSPLSMHLNPLDLSFFRYLLAGDSIKDPLLF